MPTLKERILELVSSTPGITDTQLAGSLGKRHQAVNSAARNLKESGQLVRLKRSDGHFGNYLPTAARQVPSAPDVPPSRASAISGHDARPKTQLDVANPEADLQEYLSHREPGARYASFDYCFNYFQSYREHGRLSDLVRGDTLQLSCLQLGFYLASWGMFRGAADLLQRSAKHLVPLIEVIAKAPADIWRIDAHLYGDGHCQVIFEMARRIRMALAGEASDILVTKIMLGVFGCVPAFDAYFKKGFEVATFGPKALRKLGDFCRENTDLIERGRVHTLEFESGQEAGRRYTRAKVIDMIFFTAGKRMAGGAELEVGG
jgi:hypothetical protein